MMPSFEKSKPRTELTAFSLMEVVAVVGVVSLLAAVLLPSLASARTQARSVACLSNQRQIGSAVLGYTEDYTGLFPIAQYYDASRRALVAWDTVTYMGATGPAEPGLIWEYSTGNEVQQCPAYSGPSMTVADPYTGYNYNTTYLGRGEYEGEYLGMGRSPTNLAHVRYSGRAAMIGDGGWSAGANKFMRAPLDGGVAEGTVHAGAQAYRHRNRTNVTYVDGHAESTGDRFKKPGANRFNESLLGWPENGFLSKDDHAYSPR